jgi:hypothetical protein
MKIAIFYHIAQMGMGAFIYQQQIHRLYASGLMEAADYIHFGVNGDQELFNVPEKAKIVYNSKEYWNTEKQTLLNLRDFCKQNEDYKVLYFHTKGATKDELYVQSWRLMMEYFTIDKWKDCIEYLNEYTTVGIQMCTVGPSIYPDGTIKEENPTIVYAGNFWWANAHYINTLNSKYIDDSCRYAVEKWIGDSKLSNPKNLYTHPEFDKNPMNYNYENYHSEREYIQ